MTAIVAYLFIIIVLNLIPVFGQFKLPKLEKEVIRISNYSLIAYVISMTLFFFDFKFIGLYTNTIIGLTFILSNLVFFGLIRNTGKKTLRVVILTLIFPISLYILFVSQPVSRFKINDSYTIEVSTGGFLSCGQIIEIYENKFVMFDKKVLYESSLCLREITKIETIKFDGKQGEFLIYHNGKMDSENPYRYKTEIKDTK